jgi:hypothetical protein
MAQFPRKWKTFVVEVVRIGSENARSWITTSTVRVGELLKRAQTATRWNACCANVETFRSILCARVRS